MSESDLPAEVVVDSADGVGGKPKRRAKRKKRHTVAYVLLVCSVVLGLVTALGTIYLYKHYSSNIHVITFEPAQLGDRPEKVKVEGPKEPLNILVMGSDDRDAPGNNIDNQLGLGKRSDTTIMIHLSADRTRAYGVSIPRDSLIDRPDCTDAKGNTIPGETHDMWNEAFSVGGPLCTIKQFETLSGIRTDHFVVVDFNGFKGMVDAIGGVQVCIPEPGIIDPEHGINLPAGTQKLKGIQALNYVRERYALSQGSDVGRMKRQQAFLASMARQVVSANTLARPDRLLRFLEAATKSLYVDEGLGNLIKLAKLGNEFKNIGLDKIQFITIPSQLDPTNPNRIVWLPGAQVVWKALKEDRPIPPKFLSGAISADKPPVGDTEEAQPTDGVSTSPSGTATPSPTDSASAAAEAEANGLCA